MGHKDGEVVEVERKLGPRKEKTVEGEGGLLSLESI